MLINVFYKNLFGLVFFVLLLTQTINAAGPAAVNLGTSGSFAVLSKAGISTTGTSSIAGDIGVSPAAASLITGFALVADSSTQFATSSLINGKAYAADYSSPTPAKMTSAISDMQAAYTDAAGRTNPTATELGAGNIGGMTIAPGLYKWSTGVIIPANGLTLSGGPNDVWIFQISQDLTVADGANIILSGGAQAQNVFWQVAGQATLGTTSNFKGIILSQTAIAINNGATLSGRALAQTAVTLIADTVISPTGATTTTTTSASVILSNPTVTGLTVTLNGAVNNANGWSTTWGDGTSSTNKATHTYLQAGTYLAVVTATNNGQATTASSTQSVTVSGTSQSPTASVSLTSPTINGLTQKTNGAVNNANGWSTNWGDNSTTTNTSAHTYFQAGTYSVVVTATNNGQATTASATQSVTVSGAPASTASVSLTSPTTTYLTVTMNGAVNNANGWSTVWGDNTTTTNMATHTYFQAGTYSVVVTATNNGQATTASATKTVNIQ